MMNRAEILDTATGYVTKDRQADHGDLEDNFNLIAELWSTYLGQAVEAHDVANLMVLLKVARARGNPIHPDNWVDMAGYAACGGELAMKR
jgi:hypothetical protein